jgi:hypothetical protein
VFGITDGRDGLEDGTNVAGRGEGCSEGFHDGELVGDCESINNESLG